VLDRAAEQAEHQDPRPRDDFLWAKRESGAWAGVRPDARADEGRSRERLADASSEKLAGRERDVPVPDAVALRAAVLEPYTRAAGRFAA